MDLIHYGRYLHPHCIMLGWKYVKEKKGVAAVISANTDVSIVLLLSRTL